MSDGDRVSVTLAPEGVFDRGQVEQGIVRAVDERGAWITVALDGGATIIAHSSAVRTSKRKAVHEE